MKENILIAVPARGGSKRLKRKNIMTINGKPLIAFTIEAALKSNLSDNVFVCTEDEEIAQISKKYGAEVFKIPEEMAGDEISSTVPCLALFDDLIKQGHKFEYIFNLQPTSPLRNENDIINSFEILKDSEFNFLLSVTEIDPHYFHWALDNNEKAWQMFFGKEFLKERTQLKPVYRPNGAIKLAKTEELKKTGNYFGELLTVYKMPEERSIHIGNYFDFFCAKSIIENNYNTAI